ncbi:MAG: glutamine synthetase type III [Chlorobiales bacterium]|jgi:glutamine synthetase|nr:glutamine synthetase type III [Chlorobiales bacterium]
MANSIELKTANGAVSKDASGASVFGTMTFNTSVMREKLPKDVFNSLKKTIETGEKLDPKIAGVVAHAMKEWALEHGASHYTHWFQPMTGTTAEKHDAFLSIDKDGTVIDRFSGDQLIQGEPDASSFPSGGMRTTFEARGYTGWDPSSPAFLMKSPQATTLCIPTVFISYHGEALDEKTPLLRSMDALSKAAVELLHLLGKKKVKRVTTFLGPEQEYFLVDKKLYDKRPDLVMTGRTLLGALPPKGQQLEDHYFGSIPDRVLDFMQDVERELYQLGIPAKTRHNEVAPHQFELAPIHEQTNLAADHNLLIMEVMRKVANRKGLALLLHEKPFAGINGSGKHNNWSMGTSEGENLLDPGHTPESNLQFLVFLMATLKALHKRGNILRAGIASAGNDHRLGANEAPPAIITAFLGHQLAHILDELESGQVKKASERHFLDLGLSQLPILSKDSTDRNRTSPFAFTGNKFEFRAVPSSMPLATPNAILNTAAAEAISDITAAIKKELAAGKELDTAILDVVRIEIKATKAIRYEGDNYSEELQKYAKQNGLPNLRNTPDALEAWKDKSVREMFAKFGVLSEAEIESRYIIRTEQYIKAIDIEIKTLMMMVNTQIIPACTRYQSELSASYNNLVAASENAKVSAKILKSQGEHLKAISEGISHLIDHSEEITEKLEKMESLESESAKSKYCSETLLPAALQVRAIVDKLEGQVDKAHWPIPTYYDILFSY